MATVLTTKQVGNSYCPQMRLTADISNQTDTTATITCVVDFLAYGYALYGTDREVSEKIDGTWYDEVTWDHSGRTSTTRVRTRSVTVQKGTSARNVEVKLYWDMSGYTWHGSAMSEWNIAGSIKINPKTSYSVSYNANNGSGAPSSQTKWHGTNITLSSTVPTRENYNFLGWNTAQDGTGTSYSPGDTYSANANAILYAQWELAFILPTISNFSVVRCLPDGTPDNDGQCAKLTLDWVVDRSIHQENEGDTIEVLYSLHNANSWEPAIDTIDISGDSSGTAALVIGIDENDPTAGIFNSANSYDIKAIVSDTNGVSRIITDILSQAFFTIDVLAGGKGIALGMAATTTDTYANGFENVYLKSENNSYSSTMEDTISLIEYIVEYVNNHVKPKPKRLWTGSLAKGSSVTVDGIQDYTLIGCKISQAGDTKAFERMLVGFSNMHSYSDSDPSTRITTQFHCSVCWDSGTTSYVDKASFTASDNTVTLTSCSAHTLTSSGSTGSTRVVREIWGLL